MSFGAREGDDQGAIEREVVDATLIPALDGNLIRAALGELRNEALTSPDDEPPGPQPPEIGTGDSDETDPVPDPSLNESGGRRVTLSIQATEDDLHTLQMALSGLRDLARTVRISIDVQAEADSPFDRVRFQNSVRQHLEEDPDISFEERWD